MQNTIPLLRPIAPTLARVLDSPFHALASKYIKNHLPDTLLAEAADDEAQLQELLTEPAGLQSLKTMDSQFAAEIKQLGLDIPRLDVRTENSTVLLTETSMVSPQFLLSLIFITAYFCIVMLMFFVESSDQVNMVKGENSFMDELQILLGALTAGVGQVLSFWFGRSGDKKQEPSADGKP
jgi:hypothetical protein